MNQRIEAMLQEIEKVIVGKHEIVSKILMAILASGHVLMEDVPGVGKTTTAMTFAKVLGMDTRRVQFTSDTVPSDIIGYSVFDKETAAFVYKPGAVMTNLLLADEINRTSSKTQSALLEAMEDLRNVSEIVECYVYIGEECDPELKEIEIIAITFWPADEESADISDDVIMKYNAKLKG